MRNCPRQPSAFRRVFVAAGLVVLVWGACFHTRAQNIQAPQRELKDALDRKASAEMNLAETKKGLAERLQYVEQQSQALQADRRQLDGYLEKATGDWKERIKSLKQRISEREKVIRETRSTILDLTRSQANYTSQLNKADAVIIRLQVKDPEGRRKTPSSTDGHRQAP